MKTNYTHISIVLDRSGSMSAVRTDTIGGFNTFLEQQKRTPGQATISLSQFDEHYEPLLEMRPIADAQPLTEQSYQPRGSTALFGGIGRLIEETGKKLAEMAEHDRPEKVIFVIITDGHENASHGQEWAVKWTGEAVRQAIEKQTNDYKWQFVYIGANQDALLNASRIGVAPANALNYTSNAQGTQKLYASLGQNVTAMRCSARADMSWSLQDRKEQEEAK